MSLKVCRVSNYYAAGPCPRCDLYGLEQTFSQDNPTTWFSLCFSYWPLNMPLLSSDDDIELPAPRDAEALRRFESWDPKKVRHRECAVLHANDPRACSLAIL